MTSGTSPRPSSTAGGASPATSPQAHPVVSAAASGVLPEWAVAGPERRAHMARVAALLDGWAAARGLDDAERVRWRAAGHLHDALRDEHADVLRARVPERHRSLPGPLLHGPAVAERLRSEGVADEGLLHAVAYHTMGDPALDELGKALYAADFLEPGRTFSEAWRAGLRTRMPQELANVVEEIVRARIAHLTARGSPVRPETAAFLDVLVASP